MSAYAFILFFLTSFVFVLLYYTMQPLVQTTVQFYFVNYAGGAGDWLNNLLVFFFGYSPLLFIVFNALFWLKYASTQKQLWER